jgi:Arc/MetJ family transcription regulator
MLTPRGETVRTNIDIDDALLKEAMEMYGVKTKREVVNRALQQATAAWKQGRDLMVLEGIGFGMTNEEIEGSDDFIDWGLRSPGHIGMDRASKPDRKPATPLAKETRVQRPDGDSRPRTLRAAAGRQKRAA